MKFIAIAIAIIIVITVIFFISRHRSETIENRNHNYYVKLYVPLSDDESFNPKDLIRAFKEMWDIEIVCTDEKVIGRESPTSKGYLVGDRLDKSILLLAWDSKPLSKERTDVLIHASDKGFTGGQIISGSDISSLRNHKSCFELDYIQGPDDPKKRMLFTAKLLLTLSKRYPVCGYADSSAQAYTPLSSYPNGIFDKRDLTITDLFRLFVNVQTISDAKEVEIHTHGMDQFWLPDVQIICREEDVSRDFDVLRNAAVYMIDMGRALRVGDTSELAGDGRLFKIDAVKPETDHPFGFYGAIRLRRQ